MIFKTFTEKESNDIAQAFQNSGLELETFFESRREKWGVPDDYKIIGIDAYHRLFVEK